MSSVWVRTRPAANGGKRYRVEYRAGGREARIRYGGSFKTRREATTRKGWIAGELAALRIPDLRLLDARPPTVPTLAEAAVRWRESRIDVDEQTAKMHRSAIVRIAKVAPHLSLRRLDEITVDDATALVAMLAAHPYKRETIRKTCTALAQVLDHCAIDPNPLRDPRVRLPKERKPHIPPPLAEHVERVTETVAPAYVLPLLSSTSVARESPSSKRVRSETSMNSAARSGCAGHSRRTSGRRGRRTPRRLEEGCRRSLRLRVDRRSRGRPVDRAHSSPTHQRRSIGDGTAQGTAPDRIDGIRRGSGTPSHADCRE